MLYALVNKNYNYYNYHKITDFLSLIMTSFKFQVLSNNIFLILLEACVIFTNVCRDMCSSLVAHLAAVAAARVRIPASCQIQYRGIVNKVKVPGRSTGTWEQKELEFLRAYI